MNRAESTRQLQGIKVGNNCPAITHLLFADDSLFFTLANKKSCKVMKNILSLYERASGQAVNLRKSAITFGSRVADPVKRQMRHTLGIFNDGGNGKYLGLPEQVTSRKADMFQYIIDKVREKTQGWNKRYLSAGGKEVLLKAVALAMPVYSMNIFKLPVEICDDITRLLARFWWGKSDDQRGMHWFAWDRLATSKSAGGMGFRDIENFNLALLGKQAWRILQHQDCLMARLLRGRYFADTNILNAVPKRKASYVWCSILQGRNLLKSGMRFVVGDGSLINVWSDPWLPVHPPRAPRPIQPDLYSPQVKDWILEPGNRWNVDLIQDQVVAEDVPTILSLKISSHDKKDILGWHYSKDGLYSVKSAYWLATQLQSGQPILPPPGNIQLKSAVWSSQTAPKIKHFMWRMITESLATGANLRRRHITNQSLCRRCCNYEETANHLFFECYYAQAVWRASGIAHTSLFTSSLSLESRLQTLLTGTLSSQNPQQFNLAFWILWRLWKTRNKLMLQQESLSWQSCIALAKNDANEWWSSQEYLKSLTPSIRLSQTHNPASTRLWLKPPTGWIKYNYDGSYHAPTITSQAGWMIRDDKGVYQGCGQARGHQVSCALESEFQALLLSLQHAWSRGYRKVVFEGDNQQLVEIIKGTQLHFSSYNWLRDVRHWSSKFEAVLFQWTSRKNNAPADALAKGHIPNNDIFHYYNFVPNFLVQLLHCDYVTIS